MEFPILRDLGYIVLAAAGFLLLGRAARIPPIVAYMAAGLALGPLTGIITVTESVDLISEVGVALLLFLVGLELSLAKIRDIGRVALIAGGMQVGITGALGFGLGKLLGLPTGEAAILGLALAFSSTVVVVKLLERRGDLSALYGRIAIGILLLQDVVVAIALTLLAGIAGPVSLDAAAVSRGLLSAFSGLAVLALLALLATRFVLPYLFGWLAGSLEALFIWSLSWCFLFILVAEAMHLSVELGAFVAGVSLAQLRYNEELIRRVNPLVNFFLAVFFVSLGIHMELGAALRMWPAVLVLSAFVLVGKPVILLALIPRFGYGERTAFLSGVTLGQISEFSFVVAGLALTAGLASEEFLSLLGAIGLVTIGVSATLIVYSDLLYERVRRWGVLRVFRAGAGVREEVSEPLEGHVIVVGMNTLGRRLVEEFGRRGEEVLAIDTDPRKLEGLDCETLLGNTEYLSVLDEAGISRAKLLVSALQIEDTNNLLAFRARQLGVPASIHAFDPSLVDELRRIGVSHLMVSKHDGIRQVAGELRRAGVID